MQIKHLIINNFRSYKNMELFFSSKYTSIVGENGAGKTSILDAINMCLSYGEVKNKIKLSDFYNHTNIPITIKIFFDKEFIVNIKDGFETIEIPCNGINLKIKKALDTKKNFFENFEIEHYAIPTHIIEKNDNGWLIQDFKSKEEHLFEISTEILSFPINTTNLPKIFYFDKFRNKQNYSGEYLNSSHLTKWSKEILEIFSQDDGKKLNKVFDKIEDIIDKNSDQKINAKNIFPVSNKKDFNINNFIDSCNKNFYSLGAGLETIVNLILIDNISQILDKNIIFLIDKPELHLHPQLQKTIFDYIENNSFQFIYSTHSEHMIRINKWKNIIRLHDYNKYPKAHSLKEKYGTKTIKTLLDKLENNYKYETIFFREHNELFFAKKVILVEGPIEKVCLPIILEKFGLENLLKEFTMISVNGKGNMQHFQIICKTFGIDYFSLFDEDKEETSKGMNHFLIERSLNNHLYHFKTSFEKVLHIKSGKNKAFKTIEEILELEKKDFPKEYFEMVKKIKIFLEEKIKKV